MRVQVGNTSAGEHAVSLALAINKTITAVSLKDFDLLVLRYQQSGLTVDVTWWSCVFPPRRIAVVRTDKRTRASEKAEA